MMLERGAHSNWAKNFTPDHRLDRSFDRKVYTSFEKADARHDRMQNLRYEDIFSPLFVLYCEKRSRKEHTLWLNN